MTFGLRPLLSAILTRGTADKALGASAATVPVAIQNNFTFLNHQERRPNTAPRGSKSNSPSSLVDTVYRKDGMVQVDAYQRHAGY